MSAGKDSSLPPLTPPDLVLTRVLSAPRELVFKVWTDPHHLAKWWGPNGFTNPICEVVLRPGGALRIHMRSPDGTVYPMTGIYREIVAPERLVYSSCALDKNGKALFEVLQTVTFIAEGGKTRLRVAIQIISTTPAGAPYLQGQREGWSQSLERLATYIDKSKDILMSTHSTKHATFVIERTFDFAPKVVFAAWADAEAKSRWFAGPDDWKQLHRELDFQVGGREHVRGGQPGARISTFEARYYDIVPNARIVYAYEMHLDDVKISVSLATIEFNAEDPGTRLIVTEQGVFLDGYDDAGSREHGTRGLLDRLGDALQRIAAA